MQLENVAERIRPMANHLLVVQAAHAKISFFNHLECLYYA